MEEYLHPRTNLFPCLDTGKCIEATQPIDHVIRHILKHVDYQFPSTSVPSQSFISTGGEQENLFSLDVWDSKRLLD